MALADVPASELLGQGLDTVHVHRPRGTLGDLSLRKHFPGESLVGAQHSPRQDVNLWSPGGGEGMGAVVH